MDDLLTTSGFLDAAVAAIKKVALLLALLGRKHLRQRGRAFHALRDSILCAQHHAVDGDPSVTITRVE